MTERVMKSRGWYMPASTIERVRLAVAQYNSEHKGAVLSMNEWFRQAVDEKLAREFVPKLTQFDHNDDGA